MNLREQLAAVLAQIDALNASAPDGNLSDDQVAQLEKLTTQAEELQAKIAAEERRLQARARVDAVRATVVAGPGRRVAPGGGGSGGGAGGDGPSPTAPEGSVITRPGFASDPRRGFRSAGEFAHLVHRFSHPSTAQLAARDERIASLLAAASGMNVGTPSDGSVLMPPAFSTQIWEGMHAIPDSLVPLCDQVTVDPGVQSMTFPALDESSRANGSRWGGLRGYWRAEAAKFTASQIKLREVKVEPRQLYVFCYATDDLLKGTGQALEQLMTRGAAEEISFLLNDAIINGTGVGMPRGFLTHAATVVVSKEAGPQTADTIVKANIDKMWARCHARWRQGAVWLINQDCEPELENLSQVVGTGGVPVYLPPGGITEAPNARLKGRPVKVTEWSSTLGDLGDVALVNLKAYLLALRGGIDAAVSMHLRFDYGETAFRFTFEADGQPWPNKPLTPYKGAATLSPFVTLEAR